LRSVPNAGEYYDSENGVHDFAFQPRKSDDDGLSLYRLDFVTPKYLAQHNQCRAGVYYVFVRSRDLLDLGLSLKPAPDALPGHVLVPQMDYASYKARKREMKNLQIALAKAANKKRLWGPSRALN
jgi:hypothetical protein